MLADFELLPGLLLDAGQFVAVFGGHFAEDLAGAGVFHVADGLGRGLAEDLAGLQAAVGADDHPRAAAIFPPRGGGKDPQKTHHAVSGNVIGHIQPSWPRSVTETAGQEKGNPPASCGGCIPHFVSFRHSASNPG